MASITTFFGAQGGGGISGSGAEGEVAYFDSANSVDSNSALYWDTSGSGLVIGALAPAPGVAVARIQAYGISDQGGSLLALYAGNVWGNTPIMRLSEKGTLYLSSNAGVGGLTKNVFIGDSAIGQSATTGGIRNVAIGHADVNALAPGQNLTQGNRNVFVGSGAGARLDDGYNSVEIVKQSLNSCVSTSNNTTIGNQSLFFCTGSFNVALGSTAGRNITNSSGNTFIGDSAGAYAGASPSTSLNTSCTQCVYLGASSRSIAASGATNEIVIGYNATGNGSNSVTLGDTTITNTYLRGDINLVEGGDLVLGTTTGTKIGTATTQKLAFYGDTPIVQPTTAVASATAVHGTGQAVKDDSTFGGYTIGQIVTALQTLGLLA